MNQRAAESCPEVVVDVSEKKPIRVLHVDDELGLLKVAKQCLEMQGPFQVDTVRSVEEALNKLKEKKYDAVVSDYQMPGKDGLEFLEMLRKDGKTIPFIMFTGRGREEVAIRALNLGANQYLNKTGETETVYTELAHAITELSKIKKAEELLRFSEEKYKGLFENARDVIVLLDLRGNVTSINKAAEEYGFNRSGVLGKNMLKFVSKRYWPKLLKDVAQIALGKTAKGRIEIHTPKGDKIAEYRSNPIFSDNRVVGIQTILEDATEREKAEEALRESEEEYRDLFESAMDAIVTLDLQGRISAVNSSVLRFGFKKEDIIGKNILDFVPKEYGPAVMKDFSKVAQGEPAKNEVELIVPAGKIIVEYHAGPILKENNVTGVQINLRDVTERKKSEELLGESEEKFRNLFQSIQDPVGIFVGKEGHLIDYNSAFRKLSGYPDEELKGKVFLDFVHPDDRAMVLEKYQTKYSEEELPLVYEIRGLNKKGESIPLELSVSTYKQKDRVIGIEVIHRDITERKKAECELFDKQMRLQSIFDASPSAFIVIDLNGRIVDCNERAQEIFGYSSRSEFIGRRALEPIAEEDRQRAMENMGKTLKQGLMKNIEYAIIAKDSSRRSLSVSASVLRDASGNPIGFVSAIEDVTERKKAEEALKESEEKFRNLADNSPNMIFINQKGRVVYANREAEEAMGYTAEEFCSPDFNFLDLIAPESKETVKSSFNKHMKGEDVVPYEYKLTTREGRIIYAILTTKLITYNGEPAILGTVTDITERNKMENALFETKEDLATHDRIADCFLRFSDDRMYGEVLKVVLDVMESDLGVFGYLDENGDFIVPSMTMHVWDKCKVTGKSTIFPREKWGNSSWPRAIREKRVIYSNEVSSNVPEGHLSILRHISMPIIYRGEVVGLLQVVNKKTDYNEEDIKRLGTIADHIAPILDARLKRDRQQQQARSIAHDLNERVKELTCLYGLSRITTKHGDSIEKIMQDTVLLLPPACQYPDIVCARIVWEDRKYVTRNFRETPWSQKTDIKVYGERVGAVEVYYLQKKPDGDRELFLREEKELLDAVAELLGRVIERVQERTLRQNNEQAIERSQQKFEGLFRRNPEAAVYLDLDFKIEDVNPCFCHLFGYSAEELKGRNINEVVAPEHLREEAKGLDKDAKNGYVSHDTVRKRKDGSLVPVSISAAPVTFENNLLGYVGIYKDITDLKRAQEESEESRKHFQMLFDLMADPVAVVDGRGKILEVTRKVEEITGFKKEELVGKNVMKVDMFGAKTKAVMIKKLAKRMMGMHVEPYEVEVLKKDGGKLMYEINAAKINYKGQPADLVVFRDIVERKNLEEKLRVVGSLTRHDVNNKLSTVTGNAYLLRRKLVGNSEALEQLADMEKAVRNVEAIFEFARTYENLGVEQLSYLDVKKTVDEAVGLFPDLKGTKVVNECEGLTVLADSLLRQLFYNLIDDSLKYGEKVTQILIHYKGARNQLKLIHEDDGVGISKDSKTKLFTEGFTTGKGSGYGLYLIKRMMEVYGWTIEENGELGKGARFVMTIPRMNTNGRDNYKIAK
jgi:PAS domain S-box-containing protein